MKEILYSYMYTQLLKMHRQDEWPYQAARTYAWQMQAGAVRLALQLANYVRTENWS